MITKAVSDLNATDRSALERVVGHPLTNQQQIVIQIVTPPPDRSAHKSKLPEWCNVYEGLSEAEIDELSSAIVRERSSREIE